MASVSSEVLIGNFQGRYNQEAAPTICAETTVGYTEHGAMQAVGQRHMTRVAAQTETVSMGMSTNLVGGNEITPEEPAEMLSEWEMQDAIDGGVAEVEEVRPGCNSQCIRDQLERYHIEECGIATDERIRTDYRSYRKGERWLTNHPNQ